MLVTRWIAGLEESRLKVKRNQKADCTTTDEKKRTEVDNQGPDVSMAHTPGSIDWLDVTLC